MFAPGADVRSAWNAADAPYLVASGTSQAAAQVAGAAALFLEGRPAADPATVESAIVGNATLGSLSGLGDASPNRLLYVGFVAPAMDDVAAPTVEITAPAADAPVSSTVTVAATAADAGSGVAQVAFYVDGEYVGADVETRSTATAPSGTRQRSETVRTRSWRARSTWPETPPTPRESSSSRTRATPPGIRRSASPPAPPPARAARPVRSSRAGGPVGPEQNAPNTIQELCADGAAGTYRLDESVEAIEVQSAGADLSEGVIVDVSVKVWGYPDFANDRVDLYFAADAGAPAWQYAATAELTGAGEQWVQFTYRLPAFPTEPKSGLQAVRATVRYGGVPAECTDGPYDDHDDLAFAVKPGTPDLTLPVVSLVSPTSGARLTSPATVGAVASDDGGTITRVEFFAGAVLLGTAYAPDGDGTFRVAWNVDAWPIADYTLTAVAYDASGNAGESGAVTVSVVDEVNPTVAMALPAADAFVGGIVHLEADAADNRKIARVEFRSGTTVVGVATTPPWAVNWDTTGLSGPASIVAQAWDAVENTATSAPLPISIDNTPPTASSRGPTRPLRVTAPQKSSITPAPCAPSVSPRPSSRR